MDWALTWDIWRFPWCNEPSSISWWSIECGCASKTRQSMPSCDILWQRVTYCLLVRLAGDVKCKGSGKKAPVAPMNISGGKQPQQQQPTTGEASCRCEKMSEKLCADVQPKNACKAADCTAAILLLLFHHAWQRCAADAIYTKQAQLHWKRYSNQSAFRAPSPSVLREGLWNLVL